MSGDWSPVPPPPAEPDPPEPNTLRWVAPVLGAVALFAVVGVIIGIWLLRSDGEVAEPVPVETATVAPTTEPAETPEPTEEPTDELAELPGEPAEGFDEIAEQVSQVRGLPVREPVSARILSANALADKVIELAFEDVSPGELERDQRLLVALRLIEPGVDLVAAIESLYRQQILGVYVPTESTMYVSTAGPDLTPFERVTAAHEVTHALQDQSYNLDVIRQYDEAQADMQLAHLALVEGDATLTQEVWSAQFQSANERQRVREEAFSQGGGSLADIPRYLRESLIFPYREGVTFAQALFEEGGFDAIDRAHENPPTTTAQVIHPERYFAGLDAVSVNVAGAPGSGWEDGVTYGFGEFDVRQMLAGLGQEAVDRAATGLAGGQVRSWERGGNVAAGVALAFDDAGEAAQACEVIPAWYANTAGGRPAANGVMQSDRDWMAFRCEGAQVHIGIGPDEATASAAAGR